MEPPTMSTSEAAIVGRLMKPAETDLSPELAREILSLQHSPDDQARMRERIDRRAEEVPGPS